MVAAAGVYDCESVTSSARDKTHEGMLSLAYRDLLVAAGEEEDIRQFFASDT